MTLTLSEARWFLPFVFPICFFVALSDLRSMRIPNVTVVAMFAVFCLVGLIALPFDVYAWRYSHLLVVLVIGIALNALGAMGAGDAKFLAVAAPFVAIGDLLFLLALFAANLLASFAAHRLAKISPLRRLAPEWKSWDAGAKFPMGLPLGTTMILYIGMGVFFGK